MTTIPLYEQQHEADKLALARAVQFIQTNHPWLSRIAKEGQPILRANASARSKLEKLIQLADRISNATQEVAACKGSGCAYCCHQAVMLSALEVDRIEKGTGLKATRNLKPYDSQDNVQRFARTPCPFLKDGGCSIYEHRPISCRLAMNLGASPFFCNTEIDPSDSKIVHLDLKDFWQLYFEVTQASQLGDIRDFFPG